MRSREWIVLGAWVVACFSAAAIGGYFTASSVTTWYPTLAKPSWTPPSWLFGPVWTALYATIAVAAWLVWRRAGWGGASVALSMFVVQLALNATWSILFFGMRSPGLAFAEILLLWLAIGSTTLLFFRIHPIAGALMIPYWMWVTFATALNMSIWRLNR